MTSYTRSLLQSGIRSQRIQFVSKLEMMHKYLQSAAKAQLPEYTIVQSPRDTVAQSPRDTVAQSPRVTIAQSPRVTIAQSPYSHNSPISQRHEIRYSKTQFLGNLLLSTNESSSSSPGRPPTSCPGRRTNELSGSADQRAVRVVHQRAVRVVHQRAVRVVHQRAVRVGGPNVTAACPYPALRLDKLYAALIRCLVLWTVTKQILVFLFKGLYLLA